MNRCEGMQLGIIFLWVLALGISLILLCMYVIPTLDIHVPASEVVLTDVWNEELDLAMRAVQIDPAYSHAIEEHGTDALLVRECLNRDGAYVSFQVDPGRRYLRVCLIDEKTVGFQIVDIVGKFAKEKTAYIKDNFTCIKDIFDYARKMGYPRFTKPIF